VDPGELLGLLKRRTGFTQTHAAILKELGEVMASIAPEVALAFYDYLGRDEELSKYPTAAKAAVGAPEKPFHSSDLGTPCCETKVWALGILHAVPGRVERLYGTFAARYRELFSGTYDRAYAERRRRIGLVHARLGVGPRAMVPAMGLVQELSLEHLRSALRGLEVSSAVEAFDTTPCWLAPAWGSRQKVPGEVTRHGGPKETGNKGMSRRGGPGGGELPGGPLPRPSPGPPGRGGGP
jgi:hypothetical protein